MPNYPELFFLSGPHFPDRTRLWQESKRPPINPHRFAKFGPADFTISWRSPSSNVDVSITHTLWATDPIVIIARRTYKPISFSDLSEELSQMVPDLMEKHSHLFGKDGLAVILGEPHQPGSIINALLAGSVHAQEAILPESGKVRPLRLTFIPIQR